MPISCAQSPQRNQGGEEPLDTVASELDLSNTHWPLRTKQGVDRATPRNHHLWCGTKGRDNLSRINRASAGQQSPFNGSKSPTR
ncbi:hypothetical protein AB1N83_007863 [Pleurotus pulmonarius]